MPAAPSTPPPPPAAGHDKQDRAILRALQHNGRATCDAIGAQVGLSPSAVLRRTKRLEDSGVIDRYVALVRPEAVGLGLTPGAAMTTPR